MREYKINKYLTLKLERDKTIIYISGKKFRQCKFLLLNIPINKATPLHEIKSIDEASELLDRSLEHIEDIENHNKKIVIPSEIEFWGHCSNLQVWYEYNYDTRLIHSNLAFPLLKELAIAGDHMAKMVFREEIAKRLASGYNSTVEFLYEEGYIDYLSREEFWSIFGEDGEILFKLEKSLKQFKKRMDISSKDSEVENLIEIKNTEKNYFILTNKIIIDEGPMVFTFKDKFITGIGIWGDFTSLPIGMYKDSIIKLEKLTKLIGKLKNLKILVLHNIGLEKIPSSIVSLKNLKQLSLVGNNIIKFPEKILKLNSLEFLSLSDNKLNFIPLNIKKFLTNLKFLEIYNNNFSNTFEKKIEKMGKDFSVQIRK